MPTLNFSGFIRISPESKSSKIEKPDNKPITGIFAFYLSDTIIAFKSALVVDPHPAGLEPAIL
jgi:hypothetical protein